ncbi:V/A-type H+-transporting ATPase subunit E [Streptohalobacillus salinus]|uniref:V/A-type H+-transporting ATPase subunit E n=1 Tax=Streptohalobacillus salinus TaxID=621096 RepID=A0A2V3WSZ3_9BACI|nr:V-type ATP synthase subunit E family protein [Streptohalobacillus salinus]PXW91829.1 V/A-type H+-transporting ATPase subunit E [Streptohalobacillus salinus]
MKDLQALSTQILAKTKTEGQNRLDEYEKVANDKIEEQRQKLVESQKNREEQIERQMTNDYEREAQTLANQKRNAVLSTKQSLLNNVFNQAANKMANWDGERLSIFLASVLKDLDKTIDWMIVPGERSKDVFKSDEVTAVIDQYTNVTLANETVKQKAGFLLQHGGIDYNFCFDVLVQELKKEFSPQLAALAFKTNE